MLDEEKIVNQIKKETDNYEIKTKSNMILDAYYNQVEPVVSKKKFPFAKLVPFASLAALSCAIIVLLNPPSGFIAGENTSSSSESTSTSSEPHVTVIENESPKEQTAFSIFSALTFIDKFETSSILSRKKIDLETFSEIVTAFDPTYEIIKSLFDEEVIYNASIYELNEPYVGKYGNYIYAMNLIYEGEEHLFYTDMSLEEDHHEIEQEFNGELVISDDLVYKTKIHIEDSHFDGQEVEMEIVINQNKKLKIEQETSKEEKEYSYIIESNDETIYKEELKFRRGKRRKDGCTLEIENQDKHYSFNDIRPEIDGLAAHYRYNMHEGQFRLKVVDNSHIYTDLMDSSIKKVI